MTATSVEITMIQEGLPHAPSVLLERHAAKAVLVRDGRELLMLRSRHGDYKFPGGGLEPGETRRQALVRELAEDLPWLPRETRVLGELSRLLHHDAPTARWSPPSAAPGS